VTEVTRNHVRNLHLSLKDTPASANQVLIVLQSFFKWAVEVARYVKESPVRSIKPYPTVSRERYLSSDETDRLLDAMSGSSNQEWADLIRLLMLTGARKTEIQHARWEWVDMDAGTLRLPSSKTGKATRYLAAPALKILARLGPKPSGPIFSISHHVFYSEWQRTLERAELTDLTPHDLRHNFASLAASNGMDIYMVSKLLGHTDIGTTQRYAHLWVDPQKEAVERVAEGFKLDFDDEVEEGDVIAFR
jgi:integrase